MTRLPGRPRARPGQSRAVALGSFVLVIGCVFCGCASYSPKPVSALESASMLRAQSLDPDRARAELARIAPGYDWRDEQWNGLALLAEALRLNPELARSRAAYDAALADVEASRVGQGLNVSLAAEYAFNPPESSNWLYGIAGDMLVDRGERKAARTTSAEIRARAAALDYVSTAWSVRQAIRRALDEHATWERELAVAEELLAARQRQFETLQRRVAAGEIARAEQEVVRASLADALIARYRRGCRRTPAVDRRGKAGRCQHRCRCGAAAAAARRSDCGARRPPRNPAGNAEL